MNITISNTISEIGLVIDNFADFAAPSISDIEQIHKLSIVLDEVLSNIIAYGYQDGKTHQIQVSCEIEGARLTLRFKDDGIPFNPLSTDVPKASLAIDNPRIGGLGIKLMKNLVDDMEYQRDNDFNVLHITKLIG